MDKSNIFTDIISGITETFSFLQSEFQFCEFEEEQLAYEIHLVANNEFATIDIWFEAIPYTPIWSKINGYYISHLEPNNMVIEEYNAKISNQYNKKRNDKYLKEISEILQRHKNVLFGDTTLLKTNTDIAINNNKLLKDKERIELGIYTLEYQFFSTEEFDCYEEFQNINQINQYLAEQPEIKKYRVLDCYMNEIDLTTFD